MDERARIIEVFRKNLANLISERNLTQREFAKMVGVSAPTVNDWLKGKTSPRMNKIDKICSIFAIKRSDLLDPPAAPAPPAAQPPTTPYRTPLTERDERDIEKRLQAIRDDLDSESGIALLGDHPLTEDEKEQLLIPIRSGLETARLIAKKKFTPKKYQNGAAQRQNDTATRIGKKVLNASPAAQAAVSDIIRGDEKDK